MISLSGIISLFVDVFSILYNEWQLLHFQICNTRINAALKDSLSFEGLSPLLSTQVDIDVTHVIPSLFFGWCDILL